jgi:hypothetical protein
MGRKNGSALIHRTQAPPRRALWRGKAGGAMTTLSVFLLCELAAVLGFLLLFWCLL